MQGRGRRRVKDAPGILVDGLMCPGASKRELNGQIEHSEGDVALR